MKGEVLSRVRFVGVRGFLGVVERVSRNPAARTACLPAPGSKAASTAALLSARRVPTARSGARLIPASWRRRPRPRGPAAWEALGPTPACWLQGSAGVLPASRVQSLEPRVVGESRPWAGCTPVFSPDAVAAGGVSWES